VSRLRAEGEFEVPLGPCRCDADHETDTAWLPNSMHPFDAVEAVAALTDMAQEGLDEATMQARLAPVFLRRVRWDLVEKGEPVPFDAAQLDWATVGVIYAAAADRYLAEIMAPFQEGQPKSSLPTPTEASTSPSPESGQESP
jgi:hypothetical protein